MGWGRAAISAILAAFALWLGWSWIALSPPPRWSEARVRFLGHGQAKGDFEQAELAPCYLVIRGHVVLRWLGLKSGNSILNRLGSGMATLASVPTSAVEEHDCQMAELSGDYDLSTCRANRTK
jgi:hypothetical protein